MKNTFLINATIHGLLIGLGLIVLLLVDWLLGFYGQNFAFGLLTYAVIIGGLLWSGFSYRKELGGYISYGQAFTFGLVVFVCFALLVAIFQLLLVYVIDPNYTKAVYVIAEQKMLDMGVPSEKIDVAMGMASKFQHPSITFLIKFCDTIFISAIISLITSAIIKKKDPNIFPEQSNF
jgi:hypothetical protein